LVIGRKQKEAEEFSSMVYFPTCKNKRENERRFLKYILFGFGKFGLKLN